MMSEYTQACARLLKLVMIALEHPQSDKSDLCMAAAALKRMPNQNEAFTPLARDCADKALLFGYPFNQLEG